MLFCYRLGPRVVAQPSFWIGCLFIRVALGGSIKRNRRRACEHKRSDAFAFANTEQIVRSDNVGLFVLRGRPPHASQRGRVNDGVNARACKFTCGSLGCRGLNALDSQLLKFDIAIAGQASNAITGPKQLAAYRLTEKAAVTGHQHFRRQHLRRHCNAEASIFD